MVLHTVYRIICIVTDKSYVGITNNIKIRKNTHFRHLKQNKHENPRLQNAYNKYGNYAFQFEILETDIEDQDRVPRETFWINHYDSHMNGFNITCGGETGNPICKPCEWNGVVYASVKEAALANGVSHSGMAKRIQMGYKSDADMPGPGTYIMKSCVWNGVSYSSVAEAVKITGKDELYIFIRKGYKSDVDIKPYSRPVTWNGVEYPSLNQAAIACGIEISSMCDRIEAGHTCDEDLSPTERPCVWNGIEYPTITEAAKANGVRLGTFWKRIKDGYTCDADVGVWSKPVSWNGVQYPSLSAAARACGIDINALKHRLRKGYTCDADMPFRRK